MQPPVALQLTTDGFGPYTHAIPLVFKNEVDFAQLVKTYGTQNNVNPSTRYSPATVTGSQTLVRKCNPNADRVCTSHAERANLSIRMGIRRMTRLTSGHSKKWGNHRAALALWFAYYNFCRVHTTLKTTPAVASGLAERTWSMKELMAKVK